MLLMVYSCVNVCCSYCSLANSCPPEDNIVADSMRKSCIKSGCSYTSTKVFILFHSYNLIPFSADADRVVLSKDHDQQYYINAYFFGCMCSYMHACMVQPLHYVNQKHCKTFSADVVGEPGAGSLRGAACQILTTM